MKDNCLSCKMNRRSVLKLGLAGVIGQLLPLATAERLLAGAPDPKAKALVVIWLAGGPSHLDTFDPKPGTATGGPFKAIESAAKGLMLSEHLPRLGERGADLSLIGSMTSNEGSHGRGTYFLHTGYVPTPTARHPGLGAVVAKEIGDPALDLPNFISLGGPSAGGGYLGQSYSPFIVQSKAGKPVDFLAPPAQVDANRFKARLALSRELDDEFARTGAVEEAKAHVALFARARRMMESPLTKAFETDAEPAAVKDAYGQNDFGQRCLVARKLLEAGVRSIEITLGGWDTHQDNFKRTEQLMGQLDPGVATLLKELKERDMLQRTLVVCMGEFGRSPNINAKDGRDHHPKAFSVALAGGGIKGGTVVGATDGEGREVATRPVTVPDLYATVCNQLGIDGTKIYMAGDRPITIVNKGKVVRELVG